MAENNISFRSAVGGFNRNDVLAYVRELLEESQKLKDQISSLEKNVAEKEREILSRETRIDELEKECAELKNSKNEITKLGAAMVDARRFSDQLIQEANDRVNEIYESASETASTAQAKLNELTSHMTAVSEEVGASLSDVRTELAELSSKLNEFGGSVGGGQAEFRRKFMAQPSAPAEAPSKDDLFSVRGQENETQSEYDVTSDVIRKSGAENIRKKTVIKGKTGAQWVRKVKSEGEKHGQADASAAQKTDY